MSQEPVLFPRSIRENICYGCPSRWELELERKRKKEREDEEGGQEQQEEEEEEEEEEKGGHSIISSYFLQTNCSIHCFLEPDDPQEKRRITRRMRW